ncbi:hypothetical protein, partial [Pyrobaculum sp.]|uniref:hypothetical protein n=1 Tax=Pyrobaculum sp. TaxID=2004705 RepID=UPI003D11F485
GDRVLRGRRRVPRQRGMTEIEPMSGAVDISSDEFYEMCGRAVDVPQELLIEIEDLIEQLIADKASYFEEIGYRVVKWPDGIIAANGNCLVVKYKNLYNETVSFALHGYYERT